MDLKKMPIDTDWGNASNIVNENNYKISSSILKLESSTNKYKGFFVSESQLIASSPNPKVGHTAWVGSSYPGVVYNCIKDGVWANTGIVATVPELPVRDELGQSTVVAPSQRLLTAELAEKDKKIVQLEQDSSVCYGAYLKNLYDLFTINLFDKDNVKPYHVVGYSYFDIPIIEGVTYSKNIGDGLSHLYNSSGEMIRDLSGDTTFTIAKGQQAAFVRQYCANSSLNKAMFVQGYMPKVYIPYDSAYKKINLTDIHRSLNTLYYNNLFDKNNTDGVFLNDYPYCDIPVVEGETYYSNVTQAFCKLLDKNKAEIAGYEQIYGSKVTIPYNKGVVYMRRFAHKSEIDTTMLMMGILPDNYLAYGVLQHRPLSENALKNIKWFLCGDSLTADTYAGITNWSIKTQNELRIDVRINGAMAGARWEDFETSNELQKFSKQVDYLINYSDTNQIIPDLITVSIGTNSLWSTYGDFDTVMAVDWGVNGSTIDRTTVYGGMRWGIETLKRKFPKAVFLVTLAIQRKGDHVQTLTTMNNAIKKIASAYGCIVADTYNESGLSLKMDTVYYLDGLHMTDVGATMMSKYLSGKIKSIFDQN